MTTSDHQIAGLCQGPRTTTRRRFVSTAAVLPVALTGGATAAAGQSTPDASPTASPIASPATGSEGRRQYLLAADPEASTSTSIPFLTWS